MTTDADKLPQSLVNAPRPACRDVMIDYTNWRGERGVRRITPSSMRFSATEYHPKPQWLIDAFDHEKQASRTFAVADVHQWAPVDSVLPNATAAEEREMRPPTADEDQMLRNAALRGGKVVAPGRMAAGAPATRKVPLLTDDMVDAACDVDGRFATNGDLFRAQWAAALSAAPKQEPKV